ncbi:hypothetical protein LCGC14_0671600 [marine sediment metagenome]|uniref:Uncharacterized protein n=1 Tax=marine sediment metagenome TaxID=412755 RepID=A0A0F9TC55_9ZZZZ
MKYLNDEVAKLCGLPKSLLEKRSKDTTATFRPHIRRIK